MDLSTGSQITHEQESYRLYVCARDREVSSHHKEVQLAVSVTVKTFEKTVHKKCYNRRLTLTPVSQCRLKLPQVVR